MRYRYLLPRFLLELSWMMQLWVAIISAVLFLVIFMVCPRSLQNPCIFMIPTALIAWMFKKIGLILYLIALLPFLWIYQAQVYYQTGLLLPSSMLGYFLTGQIVLLVVGLFISLQRNTFDLADEAVRELVLAYEQQYKANETKDRFLQNVNHELRTPLTAIYGYLELLLENSDQIDVQLRRTFLENAMQSCDELQLLVNNVLDSMSEGRQKRQKIYVEDLPVLDIVCEVLERFDPKTLQAHNILLHIPDYIVVSANPQYLRQIIRNLLSNAFKYAPTNTPITISASLYGSLVDPTHPTPEVCICVEDKGPGIPKDEQPLLFRQFVRLHRETSSDVRGSGLGLFLSKQFVEMMHGHIWVESEGIAGEGSTFCFTLPCVPKSQIKARTSVAEVYTVSMTAGE